jgi:glyoxylase-like metal-dependent hydrolase (beta-lactamase superfamily II)
MALGKGSSVCPEADLLLKEGDTIVIGETVINVMETPGHTEGSLCFYTDREVFSGDTLFNAGIGNTRLQTGNKSDLTDSIRNKLYSLDDDVVVRPGHGTSTTIGAEKRSNPFVRCEEE